MKKQSVTKKLTGNYQRIALSFAFVGDITNKLSQTCFFASRTGRFSNKNIPSFPLNVSPKAQPQIKQRHKKMEDVEEGALTIINHTTHIVF